MTAMSSAWAFATHPCARSSRIALCTPEPLSRQLNLTAYDIVCLNEATCEH
jgi:hypothetical protein